MRDLARALALSPATVSLALRGDPRIRPETAARVRGLAAELGYHADPVVAEGMSRARRRDFYRETVAWLLDRPPEEQPWVEKLFAAAVERGRMLGYQIEYFPVKDFGSATELRRVTKVWAARGIRAALVGPLKSEVADPALPWDEFSWVTIGQSLSSPALHRVGRDYDKDIDRALGLLHAKGCRRPGFVDVPAVHHLMKLPLLRASLVYYHERVHKFAGAYYTADLERPAEFARWLERNRPDSLVLGVGFGGWADAHARLCEHLPQIELSPPLNPGREQEYFIPDYASMGHSAVGLLHRLLADGAKGVPVHEQTVVVSSGWSTGAVSAGADAD